MTQEKTTLNVRTAVRDRYSKIAEEFQSGTDADCGSNSIPTPCCGGDKEESVHIAAIEKFYQDVDTNTLPDEVTGLSLGCGDPITLAALKEGETVLDLGSGGGIDCFLAGQRVGETGHVIGVDMTPAVLSK